jgi:hypothetical protein
MQQVKQINTIENAASITPAVAKMFLGTKKTTFGRCMLGAIKKSEVGM